MLERYQWLFSGRSHMPSVHCQTILSYPLNQLPLMLPNFCIAQKGCTSPWTALIYAVCITILDPLTWLFSGRIHTSSFRGLYISDHAYTPVSITWNHRLWSYWSQGWHVKMSLKRNITLYWRVHHDVRVSGTKPWCWWNGSMHRHTLNIGRRHLHHSIQRWK